MKHVEGKFPGQRGLELYFQGWLPDAPIKAVVIIVHGVAEHSGRYKGLAEYFASRGYAVYGYDQRGHGRSEGKRGHVEHFSYYLHDLQVFQDQIRRQYPKQKIYLFGHSMGATISLLYCLEERKDLAGLIVSGTAIKVKPAMPLALIVMLRPLALVWPKLGLKKLDSSALSHDPNIVRAYDTDPLVFRGKLSARLSVDLFWTMHQLQKQLLRIQSPLQILHGEDDRLCNPESSRLVFERASSKDKTLKLYPGLYHEILNEPDHIQVLMDIEAWMEKHN